MRNKKKNKINPDKQPASHKDWQEYSQTLNFTLPHRQTNAPSMTKVFHYAHEINKAEQVCKNQPAQPSAASNETLSQA